MVLFKVPILDKCKGSVEILLKMFVTTQFFTKHSKDTTRDDYQIREIIGFYYKTQHGLFTTTIRSLHVQSIIGEKVIKQTWTAWRIAVE